MFSPTFSRPKIWLLILVLLVVQAVPVQALTLEEAYEIALERNEEIHESLKREQEARGAVTQAKSRLYPQLEVSAYRVYQKELSQTQLTPSGGTRESTFQHEYDHQYEIELRHRLYTGGKTWSGWAIREIEARAESLRHFRRKQEVLYEVARRYYEVLLARRNLEIARNTLDRSRNQLDRAQGRHEVGELTRTGVLRAEVSVSRAEQELEQSENNLAVAREQLALAMGKDTIPEEIESVPFDSLSDTGLEHYYEAATDKRRDLKQARARTEVTAERVAWERADNYPNISLVSRYEDRGKARFSDETDDWSVRLVGSYPLFSGWKQSSEIDQARSRNEAAVANYERLKKRIRVEIKNLFLELRTRSKVIKTAENEVDSARRNYERITAEFDQGLVSSVEVNDALTALNEAESRLANARYNFQLGLVRLKLSTGTFQEDRLRTGS